MQLVLTRRHALTVAAVCLNLAITLPLAVILNVWQDDAYTLHSTSTGLAYAFHESITFEQNAPLYFVLITLWRDVNQTAAFARLFSVLLVALTLIVLPGLAARYLPRADPRWVVLTIAVNPFLVWAALEIRPYALIILLSALLLWLFHDGFLRGERRRDIQALYALCVVAALYTQYYMAFLVAAQGAYLVLFRRRELPSFLACGAAAAVAFLPMLAILPSQVQNFRGGFAVPHSPLDSARDLIGSLVRYVLPLDFLPHASRVYVALLIGAVIAGVTLFLRRRLEREGDGTILMITALACILLDLGLYAGGVHFLNRHGATLFIPAVLSVIAAFTYLPQRSRGAATAVWYVAVAAASIVALGTTYAAGAKAGDWARVASYIENRESPGEPIAVFQAENALPFEYYYRGPNRVVAVPHGVNFTTYDVTQFVVRNASDIDRALPRGARRVWWIEAGECTAANISFGCDVVERYIAQRYRVVERARFYKSDVRLLVKR